MTLLAELKHHTRELNGRGYLCHQGLEHQRELDKLLISSFGCNSGSIASLAFPDGVPSYWSIGWYSVIHGLRHMLIAEEENHDFDYSWEMDLSGLGTIDAISALVDKLHGYSFLCNRLTDNGRWDAKAKFVHAMVGFFNCGGSSAISTAAFGDRSSVPAHWNLRHQSIVHGLRMMVLHSMKEANAT